MGEYNASYIEYEGLNSFLDFGLELKPDFTYPTAEMDIEFEEVDGIDGSIAVSKNRYKDVEIEFPFYVWKNKKGFFSQSEDIMRWVKSGKGWRRLVISDDYNHVYYAMPIVKSGISRGASIMGELNIGFRIKPYKKIKSGLESRVYKKHTTINNPSCDSSKPIFKIDAVGDVNLVVNSKKYGLKGLNGYIIINSEVEFCTDKHGNSNEKADFKEYPFFNSGMNTVSVEGDGEIASFEIIPNWRRLI